LGPLVAVADSLFRSVCRLKIRRRGHLLFHLTGYAPFKPGDIDRQNR